MARVIEVNDGLKFDNGMSLTHDHQQDCCESHILDFSNLSMQDFEGLEFDLSNDSFFERVDDFGIRLLPTNGHPVSVPGYGYNNGYYSSNLTLVLSGEGAERRYDISNCQEVKE